jgi:surfactin synthase thioesterase subunit
VTGIAFHREGAAHPSLRLVCLPHAGGSAAGFRGWSKSLPSQIEVLSVELPGRGSQSASSAFTNMQALVQSLAACAQTLGGAPFVLLGHSLGGLVAFQLARALRATASRLPAKLILAGVGAPQTLPVLRPEEVAAMTDAELLATLKRWGGTPQGVLEDESLQSAFLPRLRADMALLTSAAWPDEPPLDCGASVYAGRRDALTSVEDAESWQEHFQGPFSLQVLESGHFFLTENRNEFLPLLAVELEELLHGDGKRTR